MKMENSSNYNLTNYIIENTENLFQIRTKGIKERIVLELPKPFLAGIHSSIHPQMNNGSILLHRKVTQTAGAMQDFFVEQKDGRLILSGNIQDEGKTPWKMILQEKGENLSFEIKLRGYEEIQLSFLSDSKEQYYGFGEQFSNLDMSGKAFRLLVSEQGIGRGAWPVSTLINLASKGSAGDSFTTYAPMPVFITSMNRGMVLDQNTIYHFDIKKQIENWTTIQVTGDYVSGMLLVADSPLELIEKHTAITGRLKPLPDFAYDTILGIRGGKKVAEEVIKKCLEQGTPIHALWIEDWQGRRGKNGGPPLWWRWYPDETLYPDFKNWAKELKERGIALLGYANPFLSADSQNSLYVEAVEKDYLVKENGKDYIRHFFAGKEYTFGCVDLSNEIAYQWLKEKMKQGMLENGLSGWMADYGEYQPFGEGIETREKDVLKAHCELPYLWAKLNSELIDETNNRGKVLTFHRSGAIGSNRYATAYWAGDQNPTLDAYDGLASSITALITSGISGMSINHTDIGGFTTLMTPVYKLVRKKEVLFRWLEYAAFTPVFRTHDGNYSNPLNYQFYYEEEGYAFFAQMAKLHSNLKWYMKLLEKEAVEKGYPMARALWLHFPEDPICSRIKYQYLLGEDILVNPVISLHKTNVKAYLPRGKWIYPYTGKEYEGMMWHKLPANLGRPPVLIKADSKVKEELIKSICAGVGMK